jgi:hypothetical protein
VPEKKDGIDSLLADLHKAFDDLKTSVASSGVSADDVDFLRPPPSSASSGMPEPPESGEYEFEVKIPAPAPQSPTPAETSAAPHMSGAPAEKPGSEPSAVVSSASAAPGTPPAPPVVPETPRYGERPAAYLLSDDGEIDFAAPPETERGMPAPEVPPAAARGIPATTPPMRGDVDRDIPVTVAQPPIEPPPEPVSDRSLAEGFEQFLRPKSAPEPDSTSSGDVVTAAPTGLRIENGTFSIPGMTPEPTAAPGHGPSPASPVPPITEPPVAPVPAASPAASAPAAGVVKAFILYPKGHPEKKALFCEQLAATLTRVSKRPISLEIVGEQDLADPESDIVRFQDSVLDQVKRNEIAALFLLADGVAHVEDFIKKVSPYVFIAKVVNTAELKMKSLYLDISIDVLLVVK